MLNMSILWGRKWPPRRKIFNVGPFEVSGSNEVINNQMFDYTNEGKYVVKFGPSTRRIVDFRM
jgi:penicillin amidase